MRFELVELYLENSLFLLKAQLCNGGINAHNQQGSRRYSHRRAWRERRSRILGNICILFPFLFTYSRAFALKVCAKCPGGPGCGECALLLPRVYLQTVTLMQCNDYFYSRYLGSLFAPSGMAPHWPTDYLCGCRHTWRLQPSSLSLSPHRCTSRTFPLLLPRLRLFILPSIAAPLPSSAFQRRDFHSPDCSVSFAPPAF